jgi:hypothetical protein
MLKIPLRILAMTALLMLAWIYSQHVAQTFVVASGGTGKRARHCAAGIMTLQGRWLDACTSE